MDVTPRRTAPTIPGYRILRPLGDGGMATAWLAEQLSLGRELALKVLDPALAADQAFVERFLREARLLASLRHRHVVAIHDVGLAGGAPYLAMEYLPGGSIAPLCGHCDAATALRCVREIAEALGHVHARGIVHRDVKPENILRAEDGGFVLGDFGIARGVEPGAATAPGLAFGTPAFMAPERWRDAGVDGRSDFYALGCVLHALLTGRPPYAAAEPLALGHKHLAEPIPLLPAPFELLQGLLARLLAKDPADRHPDAPALVAHVQALERELGGDAGAGGDTRLLSEWPFGSAARLLDPAPAADAPTAPVSPKPRWRTSAVAGATALAVLLVAVIGSRPRPAAAPAAPREALPLAVLPLRADGSDADLVRLADVVSEDLTTQLARQPGLQVVARTSVLAATENEHDLRQLARLLRADQLVDGQVRRSADGTVQLQLSLIDARAGTRNWTGSAAAPVDALWNAVGDAARQLSAHLVPDVAAAGEPRIASSSPEAVVAFLRGRQLMSGPAGPDGLLQARSAFDEALVADPGFVAAEAWRCRVNVRLFERNRSPSDLERARTACDRVATLDRDAPEAMLSRADLLRASGAHTEAIAAYRRAIEDPALRPDAMLGLARAQAAAGQVADAEDSYRRAQSALPGYWRVYFETGNFYLAHDRAEPAIEAYRTALQTGGEDSAQVYNNLGSAYLSRDRVEEAESAYETSLRRARAHSALSNLGTVKFCLGKHAMAADLYREALTLEPDDYRMFGNLADALQAARGEIDDEARRLYDTAAQRAADYLQVHPGSLDAEGERAWYLANLGRTAQAREALDRILAAGPDSADLHVRLAGVLVRLGDRGAAAEQLHRARERDYSRRCIDGAPWLRGLDPPPGAGAAGNTP
jgi:tetratricopeptide (TPR) repeat protein/TolB-like protein